MLQSCKCEQGHKRKEKRGRYLITKLLELHWNKRTTHAPTYTKEIENYSNATFLKKNPKTWIWLTQHNIPFTFWIVYILIVVNRLINNVFDSHDTNGTGVWGSKDMFVYWWWHDVYYDRIIRLKSRIIRLKSTPSVIRAKEKLIGLLSKLKVKDDLSCTWNFEIEIEIESKM